MFEKIAAVFSLLSVLPSRRDTKLEDAALGLWAFPLAGLVIGAIAGGIGAGLVWMGFAPILAGISTVAALLFLTGLHHIDGLADLADAFMVRGTRERKLAVLKDSAIGVGGVVIVGIYILALTSSVYTLEALDLFVVVIIAEVTSKIAMVIVMRTGGTTDSSSAAPFVRAAKDTKLVIITIIIGIIIIRLAGAETFLDIELAGGLFCGIIISLFVAYIARHSLGSLRGDTIGACNELTRLGVIICLVGFL